MWTRKKVSKFPGHGLSFLNLGFAGKTLVVSFSAVRDFNGILKSPRFPLSAH